MTGGTSQEERLHKYVATAVSLLPAFTIAALTIAVSYNVTYLYFADALDVAPLTLLDVTSKAWVIVPAAVFYTAAQIAAIWFAATIRSARQGQSAAQTPAKSVLVAENIMIVIGTVLLVISPPLVAMGKAFAVEPIDVLKDIVIGGLAVSNGIVLLAAARVTKRFPGVARLTAFYGLLVMTLGVAALRGAESLFDPKLAIVRYGESHVFCGRLISVLERGLIVYEPTYGINKFIPSSELKSIEKPAGCRLAAKRDQPKPKPLNPASPP